MSILDLFRRNSLPAQLSRGEFDLASPWTQPDVLEKLTPGLLYPDLDPSALPITRERALEVPAIAKASLIIKSTIARCNLQATRAGTPVPSTLLSTLTPGVANSQVIAAILDDLFFHGAAYVRLNKLDVNGYPASIEYLTRARLTIDHARVTHLDGKPASARDWHRIDFFTAGILHTGRRAITIASDLARAGGEAGASPVPSILLKVTDPNVTYEEMNATKQQWAEGRRRKYGSTAVINQGIDVEALKMSNENLLIQGQNWAVLEIARLTGLPSWALDGSVEGSSLSYSNSASRMTELIEFGLRPYITALEDGLSLLLPGQQAAQVDLSELINSDRGQRWQQLAGAIQSGLLTVNEARALENLPPLQEPKAKEPTNEN